MTDIIRYVNGAPTQSRQIFTGSPIVINTGGAGDADQIAITPPIPGLSAGTVQEAITEQQQALDNVVPIKISFSFGDASPRQVAIAEANTLIKTVKVLVLTPFNGINPRISVGDSIDSNRLMPSSANSALEVAEWEYTPTHRYGAVTPILLTILPDGSTAGAGVLYIEKG